MIRASLILLVTLAACSSGPSSELRPGRYSGSTREDVGISIEVAGTTIFVNGKKTTLDRIDDNRKFTAIKMTERPKFSCEQTTRGKELRCDVTWPDHTETIELMKE